MNNTPKNPGSNPMFSFEGKDVRVVTCDGKPWVVLNDVICALGMTRCGTNVDGLDADEWITLRKSACGISTLAMFQGAASQLSLLSESGLYKLILRAQTHANPVAARFQNWVAREVLPALRQDGMYVRGEEKVKTGEMSEDELVLKAMTLLQGKVSRVTQERDQALAVVSKHLLFLTVQEWLANNSHYVTARDAQELGRQAKKLCLLRGYKIGREGKTLPHPYNHGEKIKTEVNVYPLHVLDVAGMSMGLSVSMKVAC